ncbi:cytochrome P450 [Mycena pura]|uniref:Cytochrome P450 n=1 Tax=Mycena pura TaxID=153505 RepID=A0AAD6VB70_9AGAR|nr:cytochrome P450 [Mycena pura]
MEPTLYTIVIFSAVLAFYRVYRRWTRFSLADVPGPEPESFLLGSLPEYFQSPVGEADFKWQARYGHVVRVKGILGTDRLLISDPKALQHMYHSGYNIRKQDLRAEVTSVLTGPGLAWANDAAHQRQRRINSPAFGTADARSYIPIFAAYANVSTCDFMIEAEMLAQMQTIMQAGHETTATTISWTLFELSQHPDMQAKLRAEIQDTERAIHARGDTEFKYTDLEAMPYTIAVMKETLRFHPVSQVSTSLLVLSLLLTRACIRRFNGVREAARDEVLPLSKPIILVASIPGYNRNTDVFGPDAHIFNLERWLDGTVQMTTPLGVYGNLLTFGTGHRACIGWRFAVYEYQSFLIELAKNFEFSMDPSLANKVLRRAALVMVPTIAGEQEKGPQLPIIIKAAF